MNVNMENLTLFLSGVVVPIISIIIKNKLEKSKQNKEDKLVKEVQISNVITNKVENIKTSLNADRVWIMQFHNGGTYYPTNKSIQKFSMFYESANASVEPIKMLFQNIPVSLFSPSTNKILEDNIIAISDFKDETIATYGLKYTALETGSKSTYLFGIRDINNKLIGILGIDYVKRKKILEKEDIQLLEIEAAQIGGVLSNHLNEK